MPETPAPVLYHRDEYGAATTTKTPHDNHTNTHVAERATDRVFAKTNVVEPPPVGTQQQSLSPLVKPVSTPTRTTIHHELLHRHARSHEFRGSLESVTRRLLSLKSQPLLLTKPFTDARSSIAGVRSGRLVPPARREFLSTPAPREDREQISAAQQPSPPAQRNSVAPPQPAIDVGRLSEEVYRHIQRKIRIERERRGL